MRHRVLAGLQTLLMACLDPRVMVAASTRYRILAGPGRYVPDQKLSRLRYSNYACEVRSKAL